MTRTRRRTVTATWRRPKPRWRSPSTTAMATASATTRCVENVITLGVQQDPGPRRMALFTQNLKGIGIEVTPEGSRRPRDLFQVHLVSGQVPACACTSAGCRTTRTRTRSDHRCSTRPACTRHAATTRSSERARISCPIGDTRRAPRSRLWTTSWRNAAALPTGDARYTCWANLDKFLMEEVVPWVPVTFSNENDITSSTCRQLLVRLSMAGRRRSTASRSRTAARSARPDQERCGGGRATAPRSRVGVGRWLTDRFSRRSSTCCAPAGRSRRG